MIKKNVIEHNRANSDQKETKVKQSKDKKQQGRTLKTLKSKASAKAKAPAKAKHQAKSKAPAKAKKTQAKPKVTQQSGGDDKDKSKPTRYFKTCL